MISAAWLPRFALQPIVTLRSCLWRGWIAFQHGYISPPLLWAIEETYVPRHLAELPAFTWKTDLGADILKSNSVPLHFNVLCLDSEFSGLKAKHWVNMPTWRLWGKRYKFWYHQMMLHIKPHYLTSSKCMSYPTGVLVWPEVNSLLKYHRLLVGDHVLLFTDLFQNISHTSKVHSSWM